MNTRQILLEVAAAFDLGAEDLIGRSRRQTICEARHVAMYVLRWRCPALALADIGELLGGREHSTVLHGIAVVERRLAREPRLQRIVAGLLIEAPVVDTPPARPVQREVVRPELLRLAPRQAQAA